MISLAQIGALFGGQEKAKAELACANAQQSAELLTGMNVYNKPGGIIRLKPGGVVYGTNFNGDIGVQYRNTYRAPIRPDKCASCGSLDFKERHGQMVCTYCRGVA